MSSHPVGSHLPPAPHGPTPSQQSQPTQPRSHQSNHPNNSNLLTNGPNPNSNQTRYLCTLFGLIRYDSSPLVPTSIPAPVQSVARLCSQLRAMTHSDSQRLLEGRQHQPIIDGIASINTGGTNATRHGLMQATPNTTSTHHTPTSNPSLYQTPTGTGASVPQTPISPFTHAGVPAKPSAHPSSHPSSTSVGGLAPSFVMVPTFHQASQSLLESTHLTAASSHASSSTGSVTIPTPHPQIAQDQTYLLERERRLQPIVSLIASPTPWSLLIPQRFSRYVRVYRPISHAPPPNGYIADMHAWRELDLPVSSPTPSHFAVGGAIHEHWRVTHMGKPLLPTKTLCHVRPIRVTPVSANYTVLLEQNVAVAYERDYEYVQEGFRFEDRDGIEILVYQVLKVKTITNDPAITFPR